MNTSYTKSNCSGTHIRCKLQSACSSRVLVSLLPYPPPLLPACGVFCWIECWMARKVSTPIKIMTRHTKTWKLGRLRFPIAVPVQGHLFHFSSQKHCAVLRHPCVVYPSIHPSIEKKWKSRGGLAKETSQDQNVSNEADEYQSNKGLKRWHVLSPNRCSCPRTPFEEKEDTNQNKTKQNEIVATMIMVRKSSTGMKDGTKQRSFPKRQHRQRERERER